MRAPTVTSRLRAAFSFGAVTATRRMRAPTVTSRLRAASSFGAVTATRRNVPA